KFLIICQLSLHITNIKCKLTKIYRNKFLYQSRLFRIINNLQKIVSNPKLRHIYFSPHKESESHFHKTEDSKLLDEIENILHKKSPKPEETKEVLDMNN